MDITSGNLSTDSSNSSELSNILAKNYPSSKIYFPSDVQKWMKKNAKPKMALKLMQTASDSQNDQKWNTFEDIPNNLWITNMLSSTTRRYPEARFISRLTQKIAVCEAKFFSFSHEHISLNEFNFLASFKTVEKLQLSNTIIYDKNGEMMPLEYFLQCFPALKWISIEDRIPSFSSIEAAKHVILPNLKEFKLIDVEKDFNIEAFVEFMKEHKTITYTFYFICTLSPENVRLIQEYADEIGEGKNLQYPLRYVELPGQTKIKE